MSQAECEALRRRAQKLAQRSIDVVGVTAELRGELRRPAAQRVVPLDPCTLVG